MALVALAREVGVDPELELRAAARRFAGSVRERERLAGPAEPTEKLASDPTPTRSAVVLGER